MKNMSRSKRNRSSGPSSTAVKYSGPARIMASDGMNAMWETEVTATGTLSTDGSGQLIGATRTSDVVTASDWALLAPRYQEYRILAMRFSWEPAYQNGYINTSNAAPSGAIATSHGAQTPVFTSVDDAVRVSTYRKWCSANKITVDWKMNGVDEAGFIKTVSANDVGSILWFLNNGTASLGLGRFYVSWIVQFKGRQ